MGLCCSSRQNEEKCIYPTLKSVLNVFFFAPFLLNWIMCLSVPGMCLLRLPLFGSILCSSFRLGFYCCRGFYSSRKTTTVRPLVPLIFMDGTKCLNPFFFSCTTFSSLFFNSIFKKKSPGHFSRPDPGDDWLADWVETGEGKKSRLERGEKIFLFGPGRNWTRRRRRRRSKVLQQKTRRRWGKKKGWRKTEREGPFCHQSCLLLLPLSKENAGKKCKRKR